MESLVKRYFWVINLALLALLAFLAAKAINNVVAGRIATLPTRIAAPEDVRATTGTTGSEADDWALTISARNLFNSTPPDPEEAKPDEPVAEKEPELDPSAIPGPDDPCDKSDAGVSLVATMVAEPEEWSMAAIEDNDGDRLVRIGQEIVDRRVMGIHRNRLVFANGGKFECVELGERSAKGRTARPTTVASATTNDDADDIREGVKKVGANSYEIDRNMLNEQLADLSKISRQARVIPHYRDGKPQGFKIVGVRPNSLYSHIGVRSGDVLKSVNGEEITSPTKALELYEKLKTTDNVTLDVERRGRPTSLEYMIK